MKSAVLKEILKIKSKKYGNHDPNAFLNQEEEENEVEEVSPVIEYDPNDPRNSLVMKSIRLAVSVAMWMTLTIVFSIFGFFAYVIYKVYLNNV